MENQKSGGNSASCAAIIIAALLGFPVLYLFAKGQETKQVFDVDSGTLPESKIVECEGYSTSCQRERTMAADSFCRGQGFNRSAHWTSTGARGFSKERQLMSVVCLNSPLPGWPR